MALLALSPLTLRLLRSAYADGTAQTPPFTQDWSNATLITVDDNWTGVPGIIGYRGDGLTGATGVNPQTVVAESLVVDVNANQTNPNTFTTGGVTEFAIANPTIALAGSGTARAPYVQFHLDTTGFNSINVAYNLRDIDGSTDNAIQPIALQYRIGNSGNFTNVPAGFVADATTGPSLATLVTPVSVTLPAAVDNQPLVQVRVITTDAVGNDEWVGIDDINITGSGSTNPSGVGNANPNAVIPTGTTLLTVAVTPGTDPASTGHTVSANLSEIGGSASQSFFDDGSNGDVNTGDNIFSYNATVANGTTGGAKLLPFTITETAPLSRTGNGNISLTVLASTNPSGTGAANPATTQAGGSSLLTVTITPGTNPPSTGLTVSGDLSSIGGSASQPFFDNGSNGDVTSGDNIFSYNATVAAATTLGAKSLPIQISDAEARNGSTSIALNIQAPPPPAGSVVISQLYGAGGNSGATIKNDFIELINRTGAPIDVTGWSVQYASATGSSWNVTTLSGTIAPGQYFLIQEAAGAGGTVDIVEDVTGTIPMSGTAGKVALVSNNTALTDACPSDPSIVDFVGYGSTASCFEGSGPTPAFGGNTNSVFRANNGCTDTDDNADDFSPDVANPRNTSSPTTNCAILSGNGSASPASVQPGDSSTLTVNVTPGSDPTSTGITVIADLSSIGGSASQPFTPSGNSFSFLATVALATPPGQKSLPVTINDAQSRTANTTIDLTVLQPPPSADHIVISQVYGGGGNGGAAFQNDFVELYNPGSIPFDLTGWSLQYAAFDGSGWGSNKQPLGGTIAPGEYYLIKFGSGGATGAALPPANVDGVTNLSGTTGKVALVSNNQPLSGSCPLSNPNLVDFVGYGSTAATSGFCYEGTNPAAGPSGNNTISVLRKNGGNTDTNNNGNDFLTGAANPRRSAPIVELGPNVLVNDPASNGFNIPKDGNITITFTEPVDVVGQWYNILCTDSLTHNDGTVAIRNSNKTFVIIPNLNFPFGGQCTVTIDKDQVHDQDTDDSGANTDTPPSDYVWTFDVVGAGAPAPYPPSVHLTMGNPSNAVADILQFNNYLMENPGSSISFNRDKGTPNWVSWHLTDEWFGSLVRFDTFRGDPAVPEAWYRVLGTDYSGSGFDRGHMTPNADRDHQNRIPINQETYLMTNIIPQAPDNNQGPWADMENDLRTLAGSANELYIVSGPLGVGGSGANGGTTNTIANGQVTVPASTWKVVLVLPKGDNDVGRVTAATQTIAILMPNVQGIRNDPWQNYLTTVDNIEALTGYDFFANVADEVENAIEAGTNGVNPPGTAGQSVTTAEDNSVNITLTAASPGGPLTYTVVTPPTNGQLTGSGANRTYNPDPNYNGPDSFTFKVNDGTQDSNTSTVTISVTEVNDAPTANNDAVSTNGNTSVDITVTGSDVETAPASLTFVVTVNPAHGSLSGSGANLTYTPAPDYSGPDSFKFTVTDTGDGSSSALTSTEATVSITVNDTINPTITAPSGVNLGTGPTATSCGLLIPDASLGTATANDNSGVVTITRTGVPAGNIFPVGTTIITYTATDGVGNTAQDTQTVVVVDDTAPTLTLNGNTITLSPPNHAYRTVNVSDLVTSASDNCDASVNLSKVVISKVTSDEADNGGGSGDTSNDIVIAANCKSVRLRAEREGGSDGRVYTLTFRVTDQAGNSTTKTGKVTLLNSSGQAAIDSGVKHTVNGTCP